MIISPSILTTRVGLGRAMAATLACTLPALGVATRAESQPRRNPATAYVPAADPAYRDLDALVAAGLVISDVHAERPYSRLTLARFTVEARRRLPAAAPARFTETVGRLERELAAEIAALCPDGITVCAAIASHSPLRGASADATGADSPYRAIPTSYEPQGGSKIDADLNPLLQKNLGRVLDGGGFTLGVEALADARLLNSLAVQLRPRFSIGDKARATLLEGYARGVLGNVAVEAGRNHFTIGYGREAGPVLSTNARGLDLLRFSLDRPGRFPWIFRHLGLVNGSALIADMGDDVDTPHSRMIILDAALRPHPMFEIGGSMLNHQGGEGGVPATFAERLRDVILLRPYEPAISDKVFAGQARLTIPRIRSQLWVQMMTTDDHNTIRKPLEGDIEQALTAEAVWIVGANVVGLGAEGRVDVWAEGRRSGVRPHTHHQYTSGLTLDRRLLGDATGPLATGGTIGADWRLPTRLVTVSLAREAYAGADEYQHPPESRGKWRRTVDRPDEIRTRMIATLSTDPAPRRIATSFQLGYEHVTRFNFTTASRSNLLAQARVDYRW